MTRGLIITGTDTDVGKTIASAAVALYLKAQGRPLCPMKPVQSGALKTEGGWVATDLRFVTERLGRSPSAAQLSLMQPFCYALAASPHLAARAEGHAPSVGAIATAAAQLSEQTGGIQLEGAGGLFVPLNETELMIDLFERLKLPVLLIAHAGLGTINHTMLSAEALAARGIPLVGVILNHTRPPEGPQEILSDNPAYLKARGLPVLGSLPYLPELSAAALLAAAEALPGREALLRAVDEQI